MRAALAFLLVIGLTPLVQAQEISTHGPLYGWRCWIVGAPPKLRYEIEELIAARDTTAILNWLIDPSLVRQTYAAEAVIRIEKTGINLPGWATKKVNELRKSKAPVPSCVGCMEGMRPLNKTLCEFLKAAKMSRDGRWSRNNHQVF